MSLPIQISPSPIVTSTVELRITANLSTHQIFSAVFTKMQGKLPNVVSNPSFKKIQVPIQSDFKYFPDYVLNNNEYSLAISENVISLSNVNEYMLWKNFFGFIKDTLETLFSLKYINSIGRIGVRYASIFNNIVNIAEILNFTPHLNIPGYTEKFNHFRGDFKVNNYNLHLQLFDNARAQRSNILLSGAVIDIDASYSENLAPTDDILTVIDELHTEEKVLLFEKLLKPEFIETLNPKY